MARAWRGVQPRAQRQVGGLLVVQVPEAPRMAVQRAHGPRRVVVVGGGRDQQVQLAVEAHEDDVVVGLGGAIHAVGNLAQPLALLLAGALGAERLSSRSSSRRTSSTSSCFRGSVSDTRMPLRGRIVTSPSRASRCSASRMGVRPMCRLSASAYSDRNSPGLRRSVTISSSSCR